MTTTYTTRLRLANQGTGDNANTWGQVLNTGVFDLVDDALGGVETIDLTTGVDFTLSVGNGAPDQARKAILVLEGEPINDINLIVPNQEKIYLIDARNLQGNYTVTVRGSTGVGEGFVAGDYGSVYCNSTDVLVMSKFPILDELAVGDLKFSERDTDHGNWLLNNGRALDAVVNPELLPLYNVIRNRYGGVDATDFQLPDDSGRTLVGLDNMTGSSAGVITDPWGSTVGGTGGSDKVTPTGGADGHALTIAEMPAHTHGYLQPRRNDGGGSGESEVQSEIAAQTDSAGGNEEHEHTLTMDEQNNMQPSRAVYVFTRF